MYVFVGEAIFCTLLVVLLGLIDLKRHKVLNKRDSVGIFKDHEVEVDNIVDVKE
jgi:hypothetical protein